MDGRFSGVINLGRVSPFQILALTAINQDQAPKSKARILYSEMDLCYALFAGFILVLLSGIGVMYHSYLLS